MSLSCGIKAQNAGQLKLPGEQNFSFSFAAGYGISNNPCRECRNDNSIGGATVAFSLGYKLNKRLYLDFGPAFWIEGNDLMNKNVADSERPNNKRTSITFAVTWQPFENFPLTTRLGAGAAVLNYTPERNTVKADEKTFDETEIFKGFSAITGVGYEFSLSNKIRLNPGINFWYMKMQSPDINYESYIDPSRPSLTTDFHIQLSYHF